MPDEWDFAPTRCAQIRKHLQCVALGVAMNYTETRLIRLATAIGAALWLARLILSRNARNEVDAAMRTIDDATP
jgi:hypothetical protein